jgi:hypothetical protein
MKSSKYFFLLYLLSLLVACNNNKQSVSTEDLFSKFTNPPAEARTFTRWWWNGDCVEEKELLRELDVMKKAGIGGVEINPISMPATVKDVNCDCYDWLSPEWNNMVKKTIEGAKEREMIVDLIVGSGWPFGGRFLSKDERIQGVGINKVRIKGPRVYEADIKEIMQMPGNKTANRFEGADRPELFFLRLVPAGATGSADVVDLIESVDKSGRVSFNVSEGEFDLFIGTFQTGFRSVSNGAPGSDGPVLDHMNSAAVRSYLNKLSDALEAVLGGELGDFVRAIFCDSIELSGANWTSDEFINRNGYDPEPWFPFIFYYAYSGYTDTLNYSTAFNDSIMRARYDFNQTIIDLFLERFTETLHQWAHEHGLKSRYQAYGMPWLVGISEGYMIPDIPESNNWLYTWPTAKYHGFWIWNKYATSSGHLAGRRIISSESMTNTGAVFQATMEIFKWNDDFNFITGINHTVLHGYNYSPPEAGFPGWIRFGSYFNDQNTWWPYINLWFNYNSRLSALFQEAEPVSEVAILAPFADNYSKTGLFRQPIHINPWYAHDLWEACSQLGFNADYVNEKVITQADIRKGRLQFGPMSYQVLLVAGAKSLKPETALALEKYAKAGGRIIFIENIPERNPSLLNHVEKDEIVRKAVAGAIESGNAEMVEPPENNKQALLTWTSGILQRLGISSPVLIKDPDVNIFQTHYRYGDHNIIFFSNQAREKIIDFNVSAESVSGHVPWIWLPESAQRMKYPYSEDRGELTVSLKPSESLVIVYDDDQEGDTYRPLRLEGDPPSLPVEGWKMKFSHIKGDSFEIKSTELIDFSVSDDPRLRSFAGTVTYEGSFTVGGEKPSILDLGDVSGGITEVYINGNKAGVRWYGKHLYDINGLVATGDNSIRIVYTTVLVNYAYSMKDDATAMTLTGRMKGPLKQGILGPVSLH